jgi:hypothetical protein
VRKPFQEEGQHGRDILTSQEEVAIGPFQPLRDYGNGKSKEFVKANLDIFIV